MENLSVFWNMAIGSGMLMVGVCLLFLTLTSFVNDILPKGLMGLYSILCLLFTGVYLIYKAPIGQTVEFQTTENTYSAHMTMLSVYISIYEKNGVVTIQNGEVKHDNAKKTIAIIKCDYEKTYTDCIDQFKQNEAKVLTSYVRTNEPVVVYLK